jgi:formylglycine-generating enzyme required for sulfatase activity
MFSRLTAFSLIFVFISGLLLIPGCGSGSPVETLPTPTPTPTPAPKETLNADCGGGLTMELVKIPAGTFKMGDIAGNGVAGKELPVHDVTLSKDYYLGTYEVTQAQWKAVMGTEPWKGKIYVKEQDDCPAAHVSWDDATAFCAKLNQLNSGRTFRLPTEAEWERACRAGTETVYSFGNDGSALGTYAWWDGNTWSANEIYAHPVGQKAQNDYGIYDMHGNLWEWCADWYADDYYASSPAADPTGPASGTDRVLRGGGWASFEGNCRSATRSSNGSTYADRNIGFRIAADK